MLVSAGGAMIIKFNNTNKGGSIRTCHSAATGLNLGTLDFSSN